MIIFFKIENWAKKNVELKAPITHNKYLVS